MKTVIIIVLIICSIPIIGYGQENVLMQVDTVKNVAEIFTWDRNKNMYHVEDYSGKLVQLDKKKYFKFNQPKETVLSDKKIKAFGIYMETPCIDNRLSAILFDNNWLIVNEGGVLEISGSQTKYICFAGKNTPNEGLYSYQNVWQNISSISQSEITADFRNRKLTISIEQNIKISIGCFVLFEGKKDGIIFNLTPAGNFVLYSSSKK